MPGIPSFASPNPTNAPAFAEWMKPAVEPWIDNQAWIHLIDPDDINTTYDPATGMTATVEPIWSGWSRIQPIRNSVNSFRQANPTTTRIVQFWVEFPKDEDIPDFRSGLRIAVQNGVNDPYLELYQYIIVGSMNSSLAWQRTIDTVVDTESRPNYDMTDWPEPPE